MELVVLALILTAIGLYAWYKTMDKVAERMQHKDNFRQEDRTWREPDLNQ
jgi:hypothetical protein